MADDLYAWVDTTEAGIGEHTWVTSYYPGDGEPNPEKGDYWYCWGNPHERATRIAFGNGGGGFARSIANSHDRYENVDLRYGRDGVCHQMANRLLRFCMDGDGKPIKVKRAKGFRLTKIAYGEYGAKFNPACQTRWNQLVQSHQEKASSV